MSSAPAKGAVLAGAVVGGIVLAGIVYAVSSPEEPNDPDTLGYVALSLALQSGSYYETRDAALAVVSQASDPDLRFVAEILGRLSELAIQSGVTTFSEAGSSEGQAKLFLAGFFNPALAQQALQTMFQSALGDFEKKTIVLDVRYGLRIRAYLEQQKKARNRAISAFFLVVLGGVGYALEWFK